MQRIKVNLGERSYPILIGSREFEKFARVLKAMKLGEEAAVIIEKVHGPFDEIEALKGAARHT